MPQSEIARKNLRPMDSTERRLPASTDTLVPEFSTSWRMRSSPWTANSKSSSLIRLPSRVFGYAGGEILGKTLNALLSHPSSGFASRTSAELPRSPQASRPMPVRHRDRRPSQER